MATPTEVQGDIKQQLLQQLASNKQPALAKAYAAAWGEIGNVTRNAENPFHNSTYADLSAVLAAGKPVFAAHKLALLQAPGEMSEDNRVSLTTMVMHESGEHWAFKCAAKVSPDKKGNITAQGVGSVITYLRRYAAQAIFGMAPVDDDGNAASETDAGPQDAPELKAKQIADVAKLRKDLETIPALIEKGKLKSAKETLDKTKDPVRKAGDKTLANRWVELFTELKALNKKDE